MIFIYAALEIVKDNSKSKNRASILLHVTSFLLPSPPVIDEGCSEPQRLSID